MTTSCSSSPPIIGILPDLAEGRVRVKRDYASAVRRAGARPVVLSPPTEGEETQQVIEECLDLCNAFILTGGDDPRTEPFGQPTDPRTSPVSPERQAFETTLLERLLSDAGTVEERPVLGVCLGMQMMALVSGGTLDQWLADTTPTHAAHWSDSPHEIMPESDAAHRSAWSGSVTSHHRQAVRDPGAFTIRARAHDGVIEAIELDGARCVLGVQWHPERTAMHALGDQLFERLVNACE